MSEAGKTIPDVGLYAFWDVDKTKLNFFQDKDFIISRMFERGKLDDVLKIISFYGLPESQKILLHNKYLSKEGIHLAHVLLGIDLEDFSAYATPEYH